MLSEPRDIDKRPMLYLGLLVALPTKVEQAAWHEPARVQRLVEIFNHALRWRLKQVEWAVLVHDAIAHEVHQILHLFFSTEGALQNIPVWHLDANLSACVVCFLLLSLQLDAETIAELLFLSLVLQEG